MIINKLEAAIGVTGLLLSISAFMVPPMSDPKDKHALPPLETPSPLKAPYRANYSGDEHYTGHYRGEGLSIVWAGSTKQGATIDSVLDALIHRAEFEQSTDLASNDKAKALALLSQARTALRGGQAETEDGNPIIE